MSRVSRGKFCVAAVVAWRFCLLHLAPEAGPAARYREMRMLRTVALLSVFGLLALVFGMALNSGGGVGFSLLPGSIAFEPMLSARTGAPVTLEVVQKDVLWHRHTLHELRELDEVSGRTPKPRAEIGRAHV